MNAKLHLLAIALFFIHISLFSQGYAVLSPTADSYLDDAAPTINYGSAASFDLRKWSAGFRRRAVLRFDLSPYANCNMLYARLILTKSWVGYALSIDAHRITTSWTEAAVTWNAPWGTAGGDYNATVVGTYNSPASAGKDSVTLTTSVQNFVNGTYTNYGWLLKIQSDASGAGELVSYHSQQAGTSSNRPILRMSYNGCTPLPIKLLKFSAEAILNNRVKLTWQTTSEINNDFFTIERSIDMKNWKEIKQVKGAGTSNQVLNYAEEDNDPLKGIAYYRLKQTDFGGRYSYASVVSTTIQEFNNPIYIYPNPASDKIMMDGFEGDLSTLCLHNVLGTDITHQIKIVSCNSSHAIDITMLPSGIYFLRTPMSVSKICKQ